MNAALMAAYRATTYRILDTARAIDVRIDARSRAAEALLRRCGVRQGAIVTAWNPASLPTEPGINEAANLRLLAEIHRSGLQSLETCAIPDTPGWPPEPGFLILGVDLEAAGDLAASHGQNALVRLEVGAPARLVTTPLMKAGDP